MKHKKKVAELLSKVVKGDDLKRGGMGEGDVADIWHNNEERLQRAAAKRPADGKEELIRGRLSDLGFDLTKDGFGWMVRDRREKLGIPALQPTHGQNLDTIVRQFQIEL
jgi:hypothetical protein